MNYTNYKISKEDDLVSLTLNDDNFVVEVKADEGKLISCLEAVQRAKILNFDNAKGAYWEVTIRPNGDYPLIEAVKNFKKFCEWFIANERE